MARENAQAKGRRYLVEGRLVIKHVDHDLVIARSRGQGTSYELGHEPGRGWWCGCAARSRCAHLIALQLVVALPKCSSREAQR
ncbi:MAG: hypothetical protein AB7L13_07185 [Acidimicrobiia bacterium]